MAARYWVGGTDTWDATAGTKWALTSGGAGGQAVPTSADTVFFDAASGANTVTLGANANCATLNMTGFTGTLDFSTFKISIAGNNAIIFQGSTTYTLAGTRLLELTYSGATGTRTCAIGTVSQTAVPSISVIAGTDIVNTGGGNINCDYTGFSGSSTIGGKQIYGNLTLSTGMTVLSSASALTCAATSGTQLITTNGKTLDNPVTFNGVGGTFQLQDAMIVGSTRTVTLTNGTLDMNNKNLTCGQFSTNNSNVRTLAFGTGQIYLGGSAATIWAVGTGTNLTITGTPVINATNSGSIGTRTISQATVSSGSQPSVNVTNGSDTVTFGGGFTNVDFTASLGFGGTFSYTSFSVAGNLTFSSGMGLPSTATTTTFNGTSGTQLITTAGKTLDFPLTFNGVGGTFKFQDALTQGSTRAFTIINGTVQFKSGVTSTVGSFVTSGTNQKYLQSSLAGSQFTLSQTSGTVTAIYTTITDSNATGGATWIGATDIGTINGGNNTGWIFQAVNTSGSVSYMRLRSFTERGRD